MKNIAVILAVMLCAACTGMGSRSGSSSSGYGYSSSGASGSGAAGNDMRALLSPGATMMYPSGYDSILISPQAGP